MCKILFPKSILLIQHKIANKWTENESNYSTRYIGNEQKTFFPDLLLFLHSEFHLKNQMICLK